MRDQIAINKYLPIAVIYFFLNGFLLPQGLLYTGLLTPFFIYWLYKKHDVKAIGLFFLFFIPFFIIHAINGVDYFFYFRSLAVMFSVFIFSLAFHRFLLVCKTIRGLYKNLLLINFAMFMIALIVLFIPFLRIIFWTDANISKDISGINRLQMLTYEPSYYSTLLVPIALYYYIKALKKELPRPWSIIALVTIPILFSLSFGVIIGLLLAVMITILYSSSDFFTRYKLASYIFTGGVLAVFGLLALLIIYPENILFVRIQNIFEGNDTSFRGRTFEAFYLGWNVADLKSLIWGVGPGQVKLLGGDLWKQVYLTTYTRDQIAIPNATAETLAVFGIVGLVIRLSTEIYLFFKTRVYSNHYRFALFTFVFIYQFAGSFIYNIAEYVIWILAFTLGFEEFDKRKTLAPTKYESSTSIESNLI